MTTLVEDVAGWIAELRYDRLPREVVNRTKLILLDTLGCALGALDAHPLQLARQVVLQQGGNPQATPIGVRWNTSSDQVAFLDGIALRYLDLNDYSRGRTSIEEAVREIVRWTRQLAKRQETWFRRIPGVEWLDLTDPAELADVPDRILSLLECVGRG